ncbi:hypothetical protein BGX27_004605 [Mortierella sp. AM989]|nr:hypothetical protein BGX27_004605 [Mortierella sp. AM989]
MKTISTILASALLLASTTSAQTPIIPMKGFQETLDNRNNFIVAHGWGPDRWGCSFTRTQVHQSEAGTNITIGTDSDRKPYSCGEMIHKQANLTYGTYSIDMIASNVLGQVTSFFLIANGDTEIDIELTGLNNSVGWMNIWHEGKQNPISVDLPFDTSQDWHKYSFDWFSDHIVWYVDDNVVLNRSDIATTTPDKVNYKLVINSWTQVQPEVNIDWAGIFSYPADGRVPHARYRNMKFVPRVYDADGVPHSIDDSADTGNNNSNNGTNTGNTGANNGTVPIPGKVDNINNGTATGGDKKPTSTSNGDLLTSPKSILMNGGAAMLAVAFAFTMKFSCTLSILAFSGLMLQTLTSHTSALPTSKAHTDAVSGRRAAFSVPLTSSNPAKDFTIPHNKGPARWSCSYVSQAVQPQGKSTSIAIGQDSKLKPYSCGEMISRETNLDYGTYSIDMISTNIRGHVTGFFLITMDGTEIDIELTGLNSNIVHLNVWEGSKQNPTAVTLGFDAAKGWHTYAMEWRKDFVAWYVDGKQILKRSDIKTLSPQSSNYKLVLNSWTDNFNDNWAGKFVWPKGKKAVAQFRNMKYTP